MKRFLLIVMSTMLFATFSTNTFAAPSLADVKSYLGTYKDMLIHIRDYQSTADVHLLSGDYTDLKSAQLTAAIEVLQLIQNGEFDSCCWLKGPGNTPTEYSGMPSISGSAMMTTSNPSDNYVRHDGATHTFTMGSNHTDDYRSLKDIMDVAWGVPYQYSNSNTSEERMKRFEHILQDKLRWLWDDLVWSFSYVDSSLYTDADLTWNFRSHYSFACIVCFGAGFYDTSKLHTKLGNTYYATSAYNTIYNKLSTATKNWMTSQASKQYPNTSIWASNKPPIQLSTGPTWQTSVGSIRGNASYSDHIYPTHCHGATELYKTLDPMQIIEDIGTSTQLTNAKNDLPYTVSGNNYRVSTYTSVFGTTNFTKNMYPRWQDRYNSGTSGFGSYKYIGPSTLSTPNTVTGQLLGAMFYNGERDYHSMHNGRWAQLTQWARLTSPEEGTFFPLHTTNLSPNKPNNLNCNSS